MTKIGCGDDRAYDHDHVSTNGPPLFFHFKRYF
jgi:hypothetical protein